MGRKTDKSKRAKAARERRHDLIDQKKRLEVTLAAHTRRRNGYRLVLGQAGQDMVHGAIAIPRPANGQGQAEREAFIEAQRDLQIELEKKFRPLENQATLQIESVKRELEQTQADLDEVRKEIKALGSR